MKVALDISPTKTGHKVRGVGVYTTNLEKSIRKYTKNVNLQVISNNSQIKEDIDLVHFPYFDPFISSLSKKLRIKTIVTVHDLIPLVFPKKFPPGIRGRINWFIQKKRLGNVDAIITDSESSKKDILRLIKIPSEKVYVVYLAANEVYRRIIEEKSLQDVKIKYALPEKFVLYVGDATWNKNLLNLVRAIVKTKEKAVLVGKAINSDGVEENGWTKELIEAQKIINESDQFIRLGFVSTEELTLLYNLCSVFVFPSRYEGFGLPLLEAASCGVPIITSKTSSIPEVIGDAAEFVDPESAEDIASKIEKVLNNEELRKSLSKKAFSRSKQFSWKKTAINTAKIYKKVIDEK